jgi:hypothetical protein
MYYYYYSKQIKSYFRPPQSLQFPLTNHHSIQHSFASRIYTEGKKVKRGMKPLTRKLLIRSFWHGNCWSHAQYTMRVCLHVIVTAAASMKGWVRSALPLVPFRCFYFWSGPFTNTLLHDHLPVWSMIGCGCFHRDFDQTTTNKQPATSTHRSWRWL